MGMPRDIVLVRHGQIENDVERKSGIELPESQAQVELFDQDYSYLRLSIFGLGQAVLAGRWLSKEFPKGFDRYISSPQIRSVETAGMLALRGKWEIDDKWRGRNWGEYQTLNTSQREFIYSLDKGVKDQSKWFWCPPGGESLAEMKVRFDGLLSTLSGEMDNMSLIAVTDNDTMNVARVAVEDILPEQWQAENSDKLNQITSCQVLHYSRQNPRTGKVSKRFKWRRSICPWNKTMSWDDGDWLKLNRNTYSDSDMIDLVGDYHDYEELD